MSSSQCLAAIWQASRPGLTPLKDKQKVFKGCNYLITWKIIDGVPGWTKMAQPHIYGNEYIIKSTLQGLLTSKSFFKVVSTMRTAGLLRDWNFSEHMDTHNVYNTYGAHAHKRLFPLPSFNSRHAGMYVGGTFIWYILSPIAYSMAIWLWLFSDWLENKRRVA